MAPKEDPFSGIILFGFKRDGSCVVNGTGEIGREDAEKIAKNLILIASRIRIAARESPGMLLLH